MKNSLNSWRTQRLMAYGVAGTSEDSGLASHPSELCHSPYIRSPKIIIWRRLQCSPDSVFGPADASAGCCSSSSATYVPGRARRRCAGRRARYVGRAGCPVARSRLGQRTVGRGSRRRARGATVACERSLGDHWRRSSGSARRDRRRDRGSSAGDLWRGVAPRSSYKTSKVFKSHGPATRLAADGKKSGASCCCAYATPWTHR